MSSEDKPNVNATIQLDQIDDLESINLPESRPKLPGAPDSSGAIRPKQPTLPPPLPPEEAAKAFAPRTSQAPVSTAARPSAAPAKSGPSPLLIVLFVLLLGGAIYGGLRVGGIVGGAPAAASAPPKASATVTATAPSATIAAPSNTIPPPTRTISIPEVN